jgi:hypothetical protein
MAACIWGYDTHLRVNVGTPEQNDRLLAALAHELGRPLTGAGGRPARSLISASTSD